MEQQDYTLTIYAENQIGLIGKIAMMFTRRKINILSINSSPSEIDNIYRFTLVFNQTETVVRNIVRQLEKQIDVLKVFYNTDDEIIWQQMALFKVPTEKVMKDLTVERILREYGAKAIVIRPDYTVFELTGKEKDIRNLLNLLESQLTEFVSTSRIAIIKASEGVHQKVMEMEKNDPTKDPVNNEFLNLKSKVFSM